MSVIDVVVGAAFGSEGKGHVTAQVVKRRLSEGFGVLNIRVAGPNAGHTVIDKDGKSFALRQVPVGAVVHGSVYTLIAAGSEIDPPVLILEIAKLREAGHPVDRLAVSAEATVIHDGHKEKEAELVGAIGSTGKGIGAARADRIMRSAHRVLDDEPLMHALVDLGVKIVDRPGSDTYVSGWLDTPRTAVVIEGTQGYGLGLHAGLYPYTTSSNCRAIDFLAMAGVSPWHPRTLQLNVWLVARVFPIRVAGNSGPMKDETSWEQLGLPEERTTVTQKIRRVGAWDSELVRQAVVANGGGQVRGQAKVAVVLTMVDQMFPFIGGVEGPDQINTLLDEDESGVVQSAYSELNKFASMVEDTTGAQVLAMTTSPDTILWKAGS